MAFAGPVRGQKRTNKARPQVLGVPIRVKKNRPIPKIEEEKPIPVDSIKSEASLVIEEPKDEPEYIPLEKTDFVLIYKNDEIEDSDRDIIATYINNLLQKGFQIESIPFSVNENVIFIKIHASDKILIHFAEIFGIELTFQNINYISQRRKPLKCMATPLTSPDLGSDFYQRAKDIISDEKPETITNAEKGLLIYKVLRKTPFGEGKFDNGFQKLIEKHIIKCGYPLHDGPFEWSDDGYLNGRQLLSRYWSHFKNTFKAQPIDIIEQYYGPETSFYFAWLGFYIKMLIPVSMGGLIIFVLGFSFYHIFYMRSKEVCESDIFLCPKCLYKACKYEPLNHSCFRTKLLYLFDNPLAIIFAVLMSVWSTVFLELWGRKESLLQIKWNLRSIQSDYSIRPAFEEKATHYRLSVISGEMEPYVPRKIAFVRFTISLSIMLLVIILMILGIFGVMIYVRTVNIVLGAKTEGTKFNVGLFASITGSILSMVFISFFNSFYRPLAMWLTKLENPRTQNDFDNFLIYKCYALCFVNYYCVIFYLAFAKARFFTYPGDKNMYSVLGSLNADLCGISGCTMELGIQLIMVLLVKGLMKTAKQYVTPYILIMLKKLKKKKKNVRLSHQWECDYLLNPVNQYHILGEYISMMIQYGFVIFFVAAFPPAPLLALINNILELRVDAHKYTNIYRRPIAFKIPNIGAWNNILQCITYIGIATNAFVIAFTTEFVERTIYQSNVNGNLGGYVNSTLSAFNVNDFKVNFKSEKNITICYYPGKRYPPDHAERYQLTDDHWYYIAWKFVAVIIFEHVVMIISAIVAYVIPDIPFSVKEHINYQRDQIKKVKLKSLRETHLKANAKSSSISLKNISSIK